MITDLWVYLLITNYNITGLLLYMTFSSVFPEDQLISGLRGDADYVNDFPPIVCPPASESLTLVGDM